MLDRTSRQDAELPTIVGAGLMRGMWAAIVLNLHRLMPMISIKRMWRLESMPIWVL